VIVATLGLALGASVATFMVLNAVLLAQLPYREPDRVVFLSHRYGATTAACSLPSLVDYRQQTKAFLSLSAALPWDANLTGAGEPERLHGLQVSAEFFDTVGASAVRGRGFLPGEDEPGREHVVVVSYALWQRRFGGDARLLGSSMRLNGEPFEVVGIMPPGFAWGRAYGHEAAGELWAPYALTPARRSEANRGNEQLDVYGRLRPDATVERAQAELNVVIRELRARFPGRYTDASGFRLEVVPLREALFGAERPGLLLAFGGVVALLVAAATNVAGLLLARATARRRETSVRVALGASPVQLARQVLADSFVLAAAAGGVGLLLATALRGALERIDRVTLPRSQPVAIDATVAGFALLAVFVTALASGLVPALHVSRSDADLRARSGVGLRREAARTRRTLVAVQAATAFALLAQAGIIVRSLAELQKVAPGFRAERVVAAEVQLPSARYGEAAARARFADDVLARASGRPGLVAAGAISELPLSGESNSGTFEIEGREVPAEENQPHSEIWSATPGYFQALGIPLKRGRPFDHRDASDRTPVAIVSEGFVRAYFPGADPVGRRVAFEGTPGEPRWRTIVGVVGDVRDRRLDQAAEPQMYVPYAQRPERRLFLVAHTATDALAWHKALRAVLREVDPDLPLYDLTTMERVVGRDTSDRRTARAALGGFAAAALALTALGLYALLSQVVRERVPEVGVRIALGAGRTDVMRLFLAEGARLAAWGVLAGVPLAVASSRALQAFVFGVSSTDPVTFVAVGLLLAAVALAACALPAWRAARLDPLGALRSE
jgi:putative ABC transport system permease protein